MSWDDFEDDEFVDYMSEAEFEELDQAMRELGNADLGYWDANFVDDIQRRLYEYGRRTIITGKQWKQIERMKGQYL